MKIAFWSNIRKNGGVSTNMVCIAAVSAIAGLGRSVLLENHYNVNNLNDMLLSPDKIAMLHETGQYYNKYGIEYILKRLYTGTANEQMIRKASIPLLYSSIYYLPQSYIVNREVFDYEFELAHKDLFECLENISDMVFIDTESRGNASSVQILEEADMVVVSIDQDREAWDDYFEHYMSILPKSVFLVGQYEKENPFDLELIKKQYHIPGEKLAVIPYNIDLHIAAGEGTMIPFLNRNYMKSSRAENEYFMGEVKKAVIMLKENVAHFGKMGQQKRAKNNP